MGSNSPFAFEDEEYFVDIVHEEHHSEDCWVQKNELTLPNAQIVWAHVRYCNCINEYLTDWTGFKTDISHQEGVIVHTNRNCRYYFKKIGRNRFKIKEVCYCGVKDSLS